MSEKQYLWCTDCDTWVPEEEAYKTHVCWWYNPNLPILDMDKLCE